MAIFDQSVGRGRKLGKGFWLFLIVAFLLFFVLLPSVGPYTEYLWFSQDARQPQVFWLLYRTKAVLFTAAFVISLSLIYLNITRALKISAVYSSKPASVGEALVSRILTVLQDHGSLLSKVASLVLAIVVSLGFSEEWMTYQTAVHAMPFHKVDPIFGMDLSYFVFVLPWQLTIVKALLGLFVLTTILTTGLYVALQGMAFLGRIDLGKNAVRGHVAALIGLCIATYAVQMWLVRFQIGLQQGQQFTGGGYTAFHQLQVQGPLAILLLVLGVVFCIAPLWNSGWKFAVWGAAGYVFCWVLGFVIYPAILQAWIVEPNRITLEAPFASKAITMTRYAYALDQIEPKFAQVEGQPTAADLTNSRGTLDNMRLWDPEQLRQAIESLQGLKPYYRFRDVDIDRYTIGGRKQMVMLSPRDIDVSGLAASANNWVNTRLEYTHGIGVTISPVNAATNSGQPEFIVKDIPPTSPADLPITQPRIYYSDFRTEGGDPIYNYVLVDTKVDEFDYPAPGNDKSNRWEGDRGIRVGAFIPKLAFSFTLQDFNLLVSTNITGNSRLLMHRGVIDRASLIYPFLTFDQDPYMVVNNGKLVWILDGYTSTNQVPYAAYSEVPNLPNQPNYIRNSVKVVVDAYSGETNAYAVQPEEPVLQTYESIYPGLIKNIATLPAGLAEHFRYPEDFFTAQAQQLRQYHITEKDPVAFLNNEDAWDMPTEVGSAGSEVTMPPYYVQMRLPSDPKDEFLLILPFTPRQKSNMSGWIAAHCDPDRYGRLWLYEYPQGNILPGPKQMEANFAQNPNIANLYTLLKNSQSNVQTGNLLVIPIGNSVMYAEPMFLTSQGVTAIPELRKVVLALSTGQVVIGDTYADALKELFGGQQAPAAAPVASTTPSVPTGAAPKNPAVTVSKPDAEALLHLMDQADAALRQGDFAKYGEDQKELRDRVEQLTK
jgi:hypothetical protein